jgi:hypothetical protein
LSTAGTTTTTGGGYAFFHCDSSWKNAQTSVTAITRRDDPNLTNRQRIFEFRTRKKVDNANPIQITKAHQKRALSDMSIIEGKKAKKNKTTVKYKVAFGMPQIIDEGASCGGDGPDSPETLMPPI